MSSLFARTLRDDPADAEVASHKLLVRGSYIRRVAPGIYTWLPLGLEVLRKVEAIVREEMDASGAQEVLFPALIPAEPYKATDRWDEYGPTLFKLKDRKDNDYLLAPTHEEMFTLLVKDLYSSYKDLPIALYQIQTKYRDEARARAGIIRGREFVMKDAYSFDMDEEGLEASYNTMRVTYQRIFKRLGVPHVICSAVSGAMGGSRSEEFLFPTEIGEDTFVVSDGGYAANTEAVTTPPVPAQDFSDVPAPEQVATPNAKTIDDLVAVANRVHPRQDRPWTAADTLKMVVCTAVQPTGERELVIVGVPGDREVDMKRLEAGLAPADVELATPEEIKEFSELVPGYIGPMAVGPQSSRRADLPAGNAAEDEGARGKARGDDTAPAELPLRFLLDPHVARGSRWIAGGNAFEEHTFNLVYGRDFEADGFVEAAEVREGDEAPDGSGPLRISRGVEIGHIFQLGRKYAKALDLTVLDENGKTRVVTMGSYGIGVSRALAAIAEITSDEKGLCWPANIAPAQVHVIAAGKGEEIASTAENLARELEARGVTAILDDRPRVSAGVKFADYELLGMPFGLVVGRGLKNGEVELRRRATGESENVAVGAAVDALVDAVAQDVSARSAESID